MKKSYLDQLIKLHGSPKSHRSFKILLIKYIGTERLHIISSIKNAFYYNIDTTLLPLEVIVKKSK